MAGSLNNISIYWACIFDDFCWVSFKLATAPFHMWAPDVYEGAPTPVTAFLSVVSKTAGFVILIRILLSVLVYAASNGIRCSTILLTLQDYIAFIAGATMIIGNVVALRQRNIKRMFAYSSIAHAGYILVALYRVVQLCLTRIWFYLIAYLFMNLGAFAIIQILTEKYRYRGFSHFAGLSAGISLLAMATGHLLLLSLAGIPRTAGFIGKLNIITGALW